MAFSPKSKAAIGLPIREKQLLLSEKLDLGMKSFLRQTSCNQATLALRNSLLNRDEQIEQKNLGARVNNFRTGDQATSAHLGNLHQSTAKAFPINLPKHSEIGNNNYRKFISELVCDTKKRKAYFKSLSRQEEKRELKMLNDCEAARRLLLAVPRNENRKRSSYV